MLVLGMPNIEHSDPKGRVLQRSNGFGLDHVAFGCRDVEQGARWFEERLGAPADVHPAENSWYRSASIPVGPDAAVEILAPDRNHSGFHPLKTILRGLAEPVPLFWYVATDDLDVLEARIKDAGRALHRRERVDPTDESLPAYERAQIGKEFISQIPQAIVWTRRAEKHDPICRVAGFELQHPAADDLNPLLDSIEAPVRVAKGTSRFRITFESPNGTVPIDGTGFSGSSLELGAHMARGLLRR